MATTRSEITAAYALGALVVIVFGVVVVKEEACGDEMDVAPNTAPRGTPAAKTAATRLAGRTSRTATLLAARKMQSAAGETPVPRYLDSMREDHARPEAPCDAQSHSTLPGVAIEIPTPVMPIASSRFFDGGNVGIPYDVHLRTDQLPLRFDATELDEISGCKHPRQALLTFFTESLGHRYRFSTCGPTPGTYDPTEKAWTFDAGWEEYEFGWHGRASNLSPEGRPKVWRAHTGPFPPGTTRFQVEVHGSHKGEPFELTAAAPIVLLPFEGIEPRCSKLPPTILPTTAWDSPDDND